MDENRHKILITLMFFIAISQVTKNKNLPPCTNKHKNLTRGEENEKMGVNMIVKTLGYACMFFEIH
jgi:hypothetical protein